MTPHVGSACDCFLVMYKNERLDQKTTHHPLDHSVYSHDYHSDVAVLILVFNAAQSAPTMCQLFPDHISRHYRYLRDTLPDLVPPLTVSTVDLCL